MQAKFWLNIKQDTLEVKAKLPCRGHTTMALNTNTIISSINAPYTTSIEKKGFFSKCMVLAVDSVDNIEMNYSVKIEPKFHESICWMNEISAECVSLSLYSLAFPYELPNVDESVCVLQKGFENYDIIDAVYDEQEGFYVKYTKASVGELVNIIGFAKGATVSRTVGNFRLIGRRYKDIEQLADQASLGKRAKELYESWYGHKDIDNITVVVLANGQDGAYNRGNLIIMDAVPEQSANWKYSIFGHELAHAWFGKAEVNTFEDWLNETGAEWSSWLLMNECGDKELFEKVATHYVKMQNSYGLPIRMERHSETVHESGCVLLYLIYQQYGLDVIRELLRMLASIDNPTTQLWLELIATKYPQIAEYIERHLDTKIIVA